MAQTASRCSVHASRLGSGLASQKASTAGCIEATSATDGSAAASVRNTSQIGRVVSATLRHSPPPSSGTATSRNPASFSRAKSAGIEVAPRLALGALRPPLAGDRLDLPRQVRPRTSISGVLPLII